MGAKITFVQLNLAREWAIIIPFVRGHLTNFLVKDVAECRFTPTAVRPEHLPGAKGRKLVAA